MADITWFFAYRHLRSEMSSHVITFRRGQRVRSGRGLAFWFRPDRTSIAEVPADDRDTDFVFQARSRDYQVVTVQGTITWRAAEPEALASRVDFTIDLRTGRLRTDPLDRIASLLIGLAQYQAARYVEHRAVNDLLAEGAAPLQDGIAASLAADPRLRDMGLSVVTVRIAGLSPSAELARALEAPTFERAQGLADEATFARRAQAVEKERAIAENELSTKVELARRQAALIAQEDENARRQAEGRADAGRIAVGRRGRPHPRGGSGAQRGGGRAPGPAARHRSRRAAIACAPRLRREADPHRHAECHARPDGRAGRDAAWPRCARRRAAGCPEGRRARSGERRPRPQAGPRHA